MDTMGWKNSDSGFESAWAAGGSDAAYKAYCQKEAAEAARLAGLVGKKFVLLEDRPYRNQHAGDIFTCIKTVSMTEYPITASRGGGFECDFKESQVRFL
jgi:hypothetical protein